MALNSGLFSAISVNTLTVIAFAGVIVAGAVVAGAGGGVGFGTTTFVDFLAFSVAFAAFSAFSASSSTFLTQRKRASGKMCGPMTTGQIPIRVVTYCEDWGGSLRPRRVGFQTFGKWYPWIHSSRDCKSAVARTPLRTLTA
jgi:hypothetical protein